MRSMVPSPTISGPNRSAGARCDRAGWHSLSEAKGVAAVQINPTSW
jgi:hypothetical protein